MELEIVGLQLEKREAPIFLSAKRVCCSSSFHDVLLPSI